MRILSLAVALFALAAFLVGLHAPDVDLFLYAAAALLCAAATYRSAHISAFLRVFEVVFAVETIVFGAAYLVDALGLWPSAYADYALPSSLPDILGGMRLSLTVSLILAVVGEMLASRTGLGSGILIAARTFHAPDLYAGVVLLGMLGYLTAQGLFAVEARLLRWRRVR